jgi:RNA polymerase sigma-70 factor (ECF subfamily)
VSRVQNPKVGSSDFGCDSEARLVQRALQGDGDAFATLFQVHKGRVYAVCLRMTNNPADADDLTQEAFIQAFRKLATFRGESALSTWLHRVTVNTALMHFRRHARTKATLDTPADQDTVRREFGRQDDRLRNSLDRIALTRVLDALPRGYRTIFELHEIGGYGHREIARLLQCSVGNSKSQLHKAKQRIRECLVSRRHCARTRDKKEETIRKARLADHALDGAADSPALDSVAALRTSKAAGMVPNPEMPAPPFEQLSETAVS